MPIYLVTISGLMHGQVINNTMHFNSAEVASSTAMATLANEIVAHWINRIRNEHTNDVTYNNINVRDIGSALAPFNLPINISGAQGGHPNNQTEMAYVVRKRTALIGRANRGRLFIAGAQAGAADNGFLQAVRITNITTQLAFANAQWTGAAGGTSAFRMIIKHKSEGFEPVIQLVVAPQYSMLHSRRVGVGI